MSLRMWVGWFLQCDHADCTTTIPDQEWTSAWAEQEHCYVDAADSGWVQVYAGRWLCPEHWTVNDDDEIKEVT